MPTGRVTPFLAIAVIMIAAPSVGAQERRLDTPEPRYGMTEIEDGYLRLDRETGEVSHCRRSSSGWSCTATPDARRALEQEIAELREERQALRRENARLRAALRDVALSADRAVRTVDAVADGDAHGGAGRDDPSSARRARDGDGDDTLPDEAKRDIDRALDVTAYAVRRLFETFQDLEDELSTR